MSSCYESEKHTHMGTIHMYYIPAVVAVDCFRVGYKWRRRRMLKTRVMRPGKNVIQRRIITMRFHHIYIYIEYNIWMKKENKIWPNEIILSVDDIGRSKGYYFFHVSTTIMKFVLSIRRCSECDSFLICKNMHMKYICIH